MAVQPAGSTTCPASTECPGLLGVQGQTLLLNLIVSWQLLCETAAQLHVPSASLCAPHPLPLLNRCAAARREEAVPQLGAGSPAGSASSRQPARPAPLLPTGPAGAIGTGPPGAGGAGQAAAAGAGARDAAAGGFGAAASGRGYRRPGRRGRGRCSRGWWRCWRGVSSRGGGCSGCSGCSAGRCLHARCAAAGPEGAPSAGGGHGWHMRRRGKFLPR